MADNQHIQLLIWAPNPFINDNDHVNVQNLINDTTSPILPQGDH